MDLDELKQRVNEAEERLSAGPFTEVATFARNGRILHLCLTERLRKAAGKEGLWKPKEFSPRRLRSLGRMTGVDPRPEPTSSSA